MKQKNFNLLDFLDKKKYILFLILIISLSVSYFIQYYERAKATKIAKIEEMKKTQLSKVVADPDLFDPDPNLFEFDQAVEKYVDYQYYIWFEKIYPGFQMSIILGMVYEELLIERFFEFENRYVPGRKSSNNYYYYAFFHDKNLDVNDIKKKFEEKKIQFISNQAKLIDKFILEKGSNEFVNKKEFDLFLLNEVELSVKKIRRVQYLTKDNYDKKIRRKDPNLVPEELIQSKITKSKKKKQKDKLFFHPEVIILLIYFVYFSYYFFRLTLKSEKVR